MSLTLFEDELRKKCQKLYITLRNGDRDKKLQCKKVNSLTDVMFYNTINPCKLQRSCIITFGHVLEQSTMGYAKRMGANIYTNKRFLAADMDIVFRIKNIVYNLESKANIELDLGKTKKVVETLDRKHKIVFNALDCQNERWRVISKIVVWTKKDAADAMMTAKKPLTEVKLMGFKDFFELFSVNVEEEDFFTMLRNVWNDEVEVYL